MVAVMVVSVFGQRDSVGTMVPALCMAARAVLDEAPRTDGADQEVLDELEDEWTRAVMPMVGYETTGSQVWWTLDDDEVGPLRAVLDPVFADHTASGCELGSVPADSVAWSLACHRFYSER